MSQPDDFEIINVLKSTIYGSTLIVKNKHNNNRFAMKKILKRKYTNIASDKHLFKDIDHSFLADKYILTDTTNIYFITTYYPASLMDILQTENVLSEPVTRFYMSECASAINYLHSMDIIHGNLHPNNILISHDGHVKLTDFYCSKYHSETHNTLASYKNNYNDKNNSNEKYKIHKINDQIEEIRSKHQFLAANYIAPELFTKQNCTKESDWWSLGVILYECVIGYVPFYPICYEYKFYHLKKFDTFIYGYMRMQSNILDIFIPMDIIPLIMEQVNDSTDFTNDTIKRIKNFHKSLRIPKQRSISKSCKDVIFRLICVSKRRLRYNQLKRHSWFKRIPWHNMLTMNPPWIPSKYNKIQIIFEDIKPPSIQNDRFAGFAFERPKKRSRIYIDSLFD